MDELTELLKKMSVTSYEVGTRLKVKVTHVNSPDSFYVRPLVYEDYMKTIQEYDGPLNAINVGAEVIFNSTRNSSYVRGCVYYVMDYTCDIFAVDYGFVEKDVSFENIFKAKIPFKLAPLAVQCQLSFCIPIAENFDKKATDAMIYFINNEPCVVKVEAKTPDKLIVSLKNSEPDDIATMLVLGDYTALGYNTIINKVTTLETKYVWYQHRTLKIGEELTVQTIYGDSFDGFYVLNIKDLNKLQYIKDELKELHLNNKLDIRQDITMNMPVAVNVNDSYERGLVMKVVSQNEITVLLVDLGKRFELASTDLKIIPDKFLTVPVGAIYCRAGQQQLYDVHLSKYLRTNSKFKITIKTLGNGFELPNKVYIAEI